jgi:hypothetical protein
MLDVGSSSNKHYRNLYAATVRIPTDWLSAASRIVKEFTTDDAP